MDECEYASAYEAKYNAACLAAQQAKAQRSETASAYYCAKCDEPIPEARRLAQPGCQLCVDCQAEEE